MKSILAQPPLCSDLGNVYSKLGEFDKAKEYYDRALAINPELAEIYYNKAKQIHDTIPNPTAADNDQMMAYLNKCLSLNPHMYMANINKAYILRSQGKEEEAAEVLTKIVSPIPPPDFIMGIEQRGIAYRLIGELPKALNDFNYVLFYEPHNIQNLSNLAMVNLQMNNLGNADYYARKGLREADMQKDHSCDGDFYVVQQTILNIRNQMRFPFGVVQDPGITPEPTVNPDNPDPEVTK